MYPAISTAEYLHDTGHQVYVYTDKRGMRWCDSTGTRPHILRVAVPSRAVVGQTVLSKGISLLVILWGFLTVCGRILRLKPHAVIGFGGYASVPVLCACVLLRVPIFLHEQNAYAGRVNRLFAKWAKRVAVSFVDTRGLCADICTHTGNPIRAEIANLHATPYTPHTDKTHILITGGSQGAKIFGDVLPQVLLKYADKIQVVQQVRAAHIDTVKNFYADHAIEATVHPFIDDMVAALQWADIAIARSGAGTVMENACAGVPTVFVPYKYAADNHQYYNASAAQGGVVVIETGDIQNLLQKQLDLLILDTHAPTLRADLSRKGKQFFVPQAHIKIAHMVNTYLQNGYQHETKKSSRYF